MSNSNTPFYYHSPSALERVIPSIYPTSSSLMSPYDAKRDHSCCNCLQIQARYPACADAFPTQIQFQNRCSVALTLTGRWARYGTAHDLGHQEACHRSYCRQRQHLRPRQEAQLNRTVSREGRRQLPHSLLPGSRALRLLACRGSWGGGGS